MSHFTVAVRVPADVEADDVQSYVESALEPYYEQGEEGDYFMVFQDKTEEVNEDWDTKTVTRVELDGKLYFERDQELCEKVGVERFGYMYPDPELEAAIKKAGGVYKEIPVKEVYETFDSYVKEYHGYRLNDQGQYGYYSNPNAKWDWWSIGGRWMGHWPAKAGAKTRLGEPGVFGNEAPEDGADIIRIKDIDLESAEVSTNDKVEEFLKEYAEYYASGKEPDDSYPFSGPRSDGLSVGLVDCLDEDEITNEIRATCKLRKWDREGPARYDVLKPLPEGEKLEEFKQFLRDQFNRLRTFAYLDEENGWVEPGTMGWWGANDSDTESRKEYSKGFMRWLRGGNQDDWVVTVDCHI